MANDYVERIFDAANNLIQTVTYDLDTGMVTTDDHQGNVESGTISPALLAELLADAEATDRRQRLSQAVATLRQWADDAEATTATSGNAVAVLNTVVDRLGVFFNRFADLLEDDDKFN